MCVYSVRYYSASSFSPLAKNPSLRFRTLLGWRRRRRRGSITQQMNFPPASSSFLILASASGARGEGGGWKREGERRGVFPPPPIDSYTEREGKGRRGSFSAQHGSRQTIFHALSWRERSGRESIMHSPPWPPPPPPPRALCWFWISERSPTRSGEGFAALFDCFWKRILCRGVGSEYCNLSHTNSSDLPSCVLVCRILNLSKRHISIQ